MGKCWGVTKRFRFCKKITGEKIFYCHIHSKQPLCFIIAAITAILFSYIAGIIPKPWQNSDPASKQYGSLQPKYSQRTNNRNNSNTSVGLDQSSQTYTIQLNEGEIVQPLGRYCPFSISKDKNGLLISAIIHSLDEKIIAKLYNNQWILNPNNYFRKNFNKSTLEVIDEYDIPVLQVEYIDMNTIKLGGIFFLEEKEISEIYPDFPTTPKDMNPRAQTNFREGIMIIGKGGSFINSRDISLTELLGDAKIIETWFDYSNPKKFGIRKHTN